MQRATHLASPCLARRYAVLTLITSENFAAATLDQRPTGWMLRFPVNWRFEFIRIFRASSRLKTSSVQ